MSCFDCNAFFLGCKIANAPLGPATSSKRPFRKHMERFSKFPPSKEQGYYKFLCYYFPLKWISDWSISNYCSTRIFTNKLKIWASTESIWQLSNCWVLRVSSCLLPMLVGPRVNVLKESFLKPFWSLDITQVRFNTRSNWEEKLYFPSRISWVFGDLRVAFLIISFSSKMYFHPSFFSSRSHSLQFSIDQCRMNISQRYLQVLCETSPLFSG